MDSHSKNNTSILFNRLNTFKVEVMTLSGKRETSPSGSCQALTLQNLGTLLCHPLFDSVQLRLTDVRRPGDSFQHIHHVPAPEKRGAVYDSMEV